MILLQVTDSPDFFTLKAVLGIAGTFIGGMFFTWFGLYLKDKFATKKSETDQVTKNKDEIIKLKLTVESIDEKVEKIDADHEKLRTEHTKNKEYVDDHKKEMKSLVDELFVKFSDKVE